MDRESYAARKRANQRVKEYRAKMNRFEKLDKMQLDALIETFGLLKETHAKYQRTIKLLKTGDCWCGIGIGDPRIRDHSEGCKLAQELIEL